MFLIRSNKTTAKSYNFYRRFSDRTFKKSPPKYNGSDISLGEISDQYHTAIVHAGLRSVSSSSSQEAFGKICDSLSDVQNLFVPGFTPSFRVSGVFSVLYSRPEVGSFSNLAWLSGARRSFDPIHSLFTINGSIEVGSSLNDTFHPDGIFKNFVLANSCIINIGTPYLVSTLFHYYERYMNVPYVKSSMHQGFVLKSSGEPLHVKHSSYKYSLPICWNRSKIESMLVRNGALTVGLWNGAYCRIINARASFVLLTSRLASDPFYMVTF